MVSVCEIVIGDGATIGDVIGVVAMVIESCAQCVIMVSVLQQWARSLVQWIIQNMPRLCPQIPLLTLPGHDGISFTQRPLPAVLRGGVTTLSVTV